MAITCSVIANLAGSIYGKKGQFKPTSPADFMPNWDGSKGGKKQSVEQMKEALLSFARDHNKQIERQDRIRGNINRPPKKLREKVS